MNQKKLIVNFTLPVFINKIIVAACIHFLSAWMKNILLLLNNEHCISKTEETVVIFHGYFIGIEDIFPSGKSGNQNN